MLTSDLQQEQLRIWLIATGRGDSHAFHALYDATASKLFGFALHILARREWAEDILQESFVAIWNNAAAYQTNPSAPMTWISAIVRNKIFDMLRQLDSAPKIDVSMLDSGIMNTLESADPTLVELLQLGDNAKALAQRMERLERRHRQAIMLAFYHDLSYSEIAQHMKLPVSTVKTWIRCDLERLRFCLAKTEDA